MSEIRVDTISEKTSANGVTIDGLTIKDGNIIGDVALAGTTPTFTIGDAGAEDAALIFDGNAQDFYIALDDSADDLVIGTGTTIGSNAKIVIENGGNVGINDIAPDTLLHVTQGGEPPAEGMLILEANSASRQLRIQPPTDADNGFIDYKGGNLTFLDDGTEVARFQGTTGFGIGTSTVNSKLEVAGNATITTADNSDTLTLVSTDTDASYGPNLAMSRPVTGATNDLLGRIDFSGQDAAGNAHNYFSIEAIIDDATSGAEFGRMLMRTEVNGATKNMIDMNGAEIVFNEDSVDYDFRVESNGDTHALFVDAGNNRVGIGTASPDYPLTVRSMGSPSNDTIINIVGEATDANCGIQFTNSAGTLKGRFVYDTDDNTLATTVNTSEVSRYLAGGQFLINRTSSNQNDHDNGRKERFGATETSAANNTMYLSNTNASFSSYNQRNDATRAAHVGYGFFIGSSGNESDNEIRMMGDGSINSDGSNNLGSGADYAEYFEWKDGNSSDEDRRGYSVVLDGNQIVKATDSDDASKIIGVISGNPSVVGDSAWNKWNQKHLKDDFNTYIWEDYTQTEWTDADGNFISHQTDLIPDGVTAPDDAVVVSKEEDGTTNLQRRKVNPSWDSTATYIPRSDRKEWDTVGLMGKLRLKKGQPTGTNWIKMRDISSDVEEWLVR